MMKPRAHYKKPKANKKAIIATIRIVVTALVVAVFGIIFYYAATQGWEAVFAWFGGKYFCMSVMILLFGFTAMAWLWMVFKNIKGTSENE